MVTMAQVCESNAIIEAVAESIWMRCPRDTGRDWAKVPSADRSVYRSMAMAAITTIKARVS